MSGGDGGSASAVAAGGDLQLRISVEDRCHAENLSLDKCKVQSIQMLVKVKFFRGHLNF